MSDRGLAKAREQAKSRGLQYNTLAISTRAGKRFVIQGPSGLVHFGAWPAKAYLDHRDKRKRTAWFARHRSSFMDDPTSPLFYSARVLW